MISLATLNDAADIRHAFFTREGGVSDGLFGSLNCGFGSGDAPERVAENRARAMAALGVAADRLVTCHQIHSPDVVTVAAPWRVAVPRQSAPVSPPPMMMTRLPWAVMNWSSAMASPAPRLFCSGRKSMAK